VPEEDVIDVSQRNGGVWVGICESFIGKAAEENRESGKRARLRSMSYGARGKSEEEAENHSEEFSHRRHKKHIRGPSDRSPFCASCACVANCQNDWPQKITTDPQRPGAG